MNAVSAEYTAPAAALPTAITGDATDVGRAFSISGPAGPVPLLTTQFSPSAGIAEPWVAADLIAWAGAVLPGGVGQAVHTASTSVSVPFFDIVGLWRLRTVFAGPPLITELVYCGVDFPAPVLTDNGINRFWTYTVTLPTVGPCIGGGFAGATWAAVGLRGGAALVSTMF